METRAAGILLVGEDSLWLRTHERGLRAGGHAVWLANASRKALHLYDAHWEAIDIVLIEVELPGMNPAAMLAALRQINPNVSCYLVATDINADFERWLLEVGAARVFHKPLRLVEFDEIIAELARTRLQQRVHPWDCAAAVLRMDDSDAYLIRHPILRRVFDLPAR